MRSAHNLRYAVVVGADGQLFYPEAKNTIPRCRRPNLLCIRRGNACPAVRPPELLDPNLHVED